MQTGTNCSCSPGALYNQLFYIQAVLCVLTGVCCALSVIPVPGVIDGYVGAYTAPPIVIIFSFVRKIGEKKIFFL